MTTRTITIEHNGTTYYGHIAKIESTHLGLEDHGIVTAYLHCEWEGGGVSVGGYGLDAPVHRDGEFSHREGTSYGLDHIMAMVRTVGVESWEGLSGSDAIVLFESKHPLGSMSKGIAGLHNDKVLILAEHAAQWKADHQESES